MLAHEVINTIRKVKPTTDSNATLYGYYIGGANSLSTVTKNKMATGELVRKQ
jgi:hypothetical protein